MGKIAFVFAGQGAQHSGMGLDYYEQNDTAKEIFERAEKERSKTLLQCFYSDEAVLKETRNTQPCMFAFEVAIAQALIEKGVTPDVVAGFSLGELSALTVAGAASFESLFALVCKRGALMQEAAEAHPTAMAAVVKLSNEEVEAICHQFEGVYPVNYNCVGNVSVAMEEPLMANFKDAVKQSGGRALPLKVAGGFHSPFMAEAGAAFADALKDWQVAPLKMPVIANLNGKAYGEDLKATLAAQMTSPVRWEESVRAMIADGVDTFIEIGPGDTLCGMIKRIDGTVALYTTGTYENFEQIVEEVTK